MKILLMCSAGMSTSLVETKIRKYMSEQNIEGKVSALSSGEGKQQIKEWDIIMLGPQVAFMLDEIKEIADEIPVVVIPPMFYAMAKAKEIVEFAIKEIDKSA